MFDGGKVLTAKEAAAKVKEITGRQLMEPDLKAVPKRAIVVRMLHNLLHVAGDEGDAAGSLRYLDAIITLTDSVQERGMRAGLRYKTGDNAGALKDVDWLLKKMPEGVDVERLREFQKLLKEE